MLLYQVTDVSAFYRNLRIREDTAKYLLNLDVNSAHYDPKTRSMREDPPPNMDPNEKFYVVSVSVCLVHQIVLIFLFYIFWLTHA